LNQTGQQVLQVVAECLKVVVAGEVLLLLRPAVDRVDHAADELLDAALALRRADDAPEILGHHDVGCLLRPEPRDFYVALLEDERPLLVADDGRTHLPFNLVERIDPFASKETLELEPRHGRRLSRRAGDGCLGAGRFDRAPRGQTRGSCDAFVH
jgi:hypothetical protein